MHILQDGDCFKIEKSATWESEIGYDAATGAKSIGKARNKRDDSEEAKACERSSPSDPEAFLSAEVCVGVGESSHGPEFDGGVDLGEFSAGERVAEFVDHDGDEDDDDPEKGADKGVSAIDTEAIAKEKADGPKPRFNAHRDIKQFEIEHRVNLMRAAQLANKR